MVTRYGYAQVRLLYPRLPSHNGRGGGGHTRVSVDVTVTVVQYVLQHFSHRLKWRFKSSHSPSFASRFCRCGILAAADVAVKKTRKIPAEIMATMRSKSAKQKGGELSYSLFFLPSAGRRRNTYIPPRTLQLRGLALILQQGLGYLHVGSRRVPLCDTERDAPQLAIKRFR